MGPPGRRFLILACLAAVLHAQLSLAQSCFNNGGCTGLNGPCATGVCNSGTCIAVPRPAGILCRAAAGPCDTQEVCTGATTTCPPNVFRPTSFVCRAATGPCDAAETCAGGPACPGDALLPSGSVCAPAVGACELAAVCSGSSPTCPAKGLKPAGTVCRYAQGPCDVNEVCSGAAATCPANAFAPSGSPCDGIAGNPKLCDGVAAACPGYLLDEVITQDLCPTSGCDSSCTSSTFLPNQCILASGGAASFKWVCTDSGVLQTTYAGPGCTGTPSSVSVQTTGACQFLGLQYISLSCGPAYNAPQVVERTVCTGAGCSAGCQPVATFGRADCAPGLDGGSEWLVCTTAGAVQRWTFSSTDCSGTATKKDLPPLDTCNIDGSKSVTYHCVTPPTLPQVIDQRVCDATTPGCSTNCMLTSTIPKCQPNGPDSQRLRCTAYGILADLYHTPDCTSGSYFTTLTPFSQCNYFAGGSYDRHCREPVLQLDQVITQNLCPTSGCDSSCTSSTFLPNQCLLASGGAASYKLVCTDGGGILQTTYAGPGCTGTPTSVSLQPVDACQFLGLQYISLSCGLASIAPQVVERTVCTGAGCSASCQPVATFGRADCAPGLDGGSEWLVCTTAGAVQRWTFSSTDCSGTATKKDLPPLDTCNIDGSKSVTYHCVTPPILPQVIDQRVCDATTPGCSTNCMLTTLIPKCFPNGANGQRLQCTAYGILGDLHHTTDCTDTSYFTTLTPFSQCNFFAGGSYDRHCRDPVLTGDWIDVTQCTVAGCPASPCTVTTILPNVCTAAPGGGSQTWVCSDVGIVQKHYPTSDCSGTPEYSFLPVNTCEDGAGGSTTRVCRPPSVTCFDTNIVQNGGAESGTASWTPLYGNVQARTGTPISGQVGSRLFYAPGGASGSEQWVSLSACDLAKIATGSYKVKVTGQIGGTGSFTDGAWLTVELYNAAGVRLSAVSNGPVPASQRNYQTKVLFAQTQTPLLPTTRSIRLILGFDGSHGFMDEISVVLAL